jgi:hypothetical protein
VRRNRATLAVALVAAFAISGPAAAAATKFLLGGTNVAGTTTTIQTAADAAVLQLQNSNATGGTSAGGLAITVPAGRAPLTVNAGAGKATNLDADKLDGHDAGDFVLDPADGWHEIGTASEPAWGRPTLTSIEPFLPAAFKKDPFGVVHLQGHVLAALDQPDGCDAYALFTLPAGYRPAGDVTVAAISGVADVASTHTLAQVDIFPNGTVELCFPRLVQYGWVALDGITFQAAP